MINIKYLDYADIDLIWQQISRRELITQYYVNEQHQLKLKDCFYDVKNWDNDHLQYDPPKLKELFQAGAIFVGLFNASNQMVGISVVSDQVIHDYPDAKLLAYFYIDADQQGQGLGTQLMQFSISLLKQLGEKIFIYFSHPHPKNSRFLSSTRCSITI